MAYTILTEPGCTVTQKDVWAILPDNLVQPGTRQLLEAFDAMIKEKYLESSPKSEEFPKIPGDLLDQDENEALDPAEQDMHAYEADDYTPEKLDKYLTAFVMVLQGEETV